MQSAFTEKPKEVVTYQGINIFSFHIEGSGNIDLATVNSFGEEWQKFGSFSEKDISQIGDDYFDIVPDEIYAGKKVLDVGCGTGRWTKYVARKACFVEAIDPSDAVFSAAHLLSGIENTRISRASVDNIPFQDNSFDLVFSLGVLHHIPDTEIAMKSCIAKLKQDGYFLVYLYYNFDNRSFFFKSLFHLSNVFRKIISRLPPAIKRFICDLLAFFVYLPFVSITKLLRWIGLRKLSSKIPLSWYADKSLWIIRNDALDRFGTQLEKRFSKTEIKAMMERCGLQNIIFSNKEPYWHAIGQKI